MISSSEELVETERNRVRNSERERELDLERERGRDLERELERGSGRDLERRGDLGYELGLERGSDLERELVGSSAGRMSPRAARASEKVESIDESGDDRVVWGFKVSPCDELALTNAVALVLDLVVGVVSGMSKKNR